MMARNFWLIGGLLSVLGLLVMVTGEQQAGGILDYRAWLLIAFGLLAMVIGNFGETANRDH
jgi:hypothetical protein